MIQNINLIYIVPLFYFLPFAVIFALIYSLKNIKTINQKNNNLIILLYICSIINCLKTLFKCDILGYGSYTFPLLFLAMLVFIINLPLYEKFKKEYINNIIKMILIYFILISISVIFTTCIKKYTLTFDRGTLSDVSEISSATLLLKQYFTKTSKDSTLLVIPEGIMLNFITERENPLIKYYNLCPPYINAFGIEKILDDIKKAKIDYIVITDRDIEEYSTVKNYCEDYHGRKICEFIKKNYKLDNSFGRNDEYMVYKLIQH